MYLKPIELPYHVRQYETFVRRFGNGAAHAVAESLYKRAMAGFRGERSLTYPLRYLAEDQFSIFHNLRLSDSLYFF